MEGEFGRWGGGLWMGGVGDGVGVAVQMRYMYVLHIKWRRAK